MYNTLKAIAFKDQTRTSITLILNYTYNIKIYLQNSFEIECKAIPQSKFSTRSASDKTSTLWCPSHTKNRTTHFIGSRFYEPRGNCIYWIVNITWWRE